MDNIWSTLAQSGIAIFVLALVCWFFWKAMQADKAKSESRYDSLEKSRDLLQDRLSSYIEESNKRFIDFINATREKNELIEQQWQKTIQENTEILRDLKKLIEQKF